MKFNCLLLTLFVLPVATLPAATVTSTFSAEVQEDQIRGFNGDPSRAFFNVQGDDDNFTVYSIVDFDGAGFDFSGLGSGDIESISLEIAQSNAGFSTAGGLEFFLASDTRAITLEDTARYLQSGNSSSPNNGAAVVGSAFGTLYSLGTGTYTPTASGDIDTFSFSLDADGNAFLANQLNTGGLVRVIGTPGEAGLAATYSGSDSLLTPPFAPRLTITAVPEPSSVLALGLIGLTAACYRRRRKVQ